MDLWCHAPGCSSHTHPAALIQSAGWGGEDVYHAAELPASQLVCHSLRPETHWERKAWGREHCILLSIPLFSLVFPSSPLTFIFLVVACPLRAKGLLHSVCMCVAGCIWLVDFPLYTPIHPSFKAEVLVGHFHTCTHTHIQRNTPIHTKNGVITLCSHVIPQVLYLSPLQHIWHPAPIHGFTSVVVPAPKHSPTS